MRSTLVLWFSFVFLAGCQSVPKKQTAATMPTESAATATVTPALRFVTHMRQMTFAGRRAGEGYFSRDGRYMIFQSEREKGNPFYQIYVMDLKTGATHRVSTGQGKTTCSWIRPDDKAVIFSSTHADPLLKQKTEQEWEARRNPNKSRYSWSFDDAYDIYQADFNGRHLKNLTHTKGYDAESSYSPDGKYIAFSSNRAAYNEPMTAEQKKLFAQNPSTMMDIYIMRADGTHVRRLTNAPGYDGGPFFSPDGKRIVFRRFSLDGMRAEIYTMKTDGTDLRQITHMGVMSWAPFYHPSGDYIIFATNKQGMRNFELYIVDSEGRHKPVRVTDIAGFDGLPVFTPDGQHLVWTHAGADGQGQLYQADWNDALAREALGLKPAQPTDAQSWVQYLSSDYFEGRLTGSPKEIEYMHTLAHSFAKMGLKPGAGKSFIQDYEFTSGIQLDPGNTAVLKTGSTTQTLALQSDWMPLSYSESGRFKSAPLVFVGYGIVAPAGENQPGYDSYKNVDVKGKWVVAFAGLPGDIGNQGRFHLHLYSRVEHKAMMARQHGAIGLILITDSETPAAKLALKFEGRTQGVGLPVLKLSTAAADSLFAAAHTTRAEYTQHLAKGETGSFTFPQAELQANIYLHFTKSRAHNALALLRVPGAKSTIVIGAHGDHLGHGEMGNSLARPDERGEIHPGADDNASGVAGVMRIARELSTAVRQHKAHLKQNVLFAVWTGEEIGMLGSTHFLDANKSYKISAYLNMDMIGRLRDHLFVQGLGSAEGWQPIVERLAVNAPVSIETQNDPYLPTDALAFYLKHIPILAFFTGSHPEYHSPRDKWNLINFEGLDQVADLVGRTAATLASYARLPLKYRHVKDSRRGDDQRAFRLYLGTIPDYSHESKSGVLISGTSKGSPAEKAGLKAGDKIVDLGGMKIKNLYDFVYCLEALKANKATTMHIIRNGKLTELNITPTLRVQ